LPRRFELLGCHANSFRALIAFGRAKQRFRHAGRGRISQAEQIAEHLLAQIDLDGRCRLIGNREIDPANVFVVGGFGRLRLGGDNGDTHDDRKHTSAWHVPT
jgi:hypothetical protein